MRNYISLQPYLPVNELKSRYLKAEEPVAARQWHTLWLLAKGKKVKEVAEVTGYAEYWVWALVRRHNKKGVEAVGDKRHNNLGFSLKVPRPTHKKRNKKASYDFKKNSLGS